MPCGWRIFYFALVNLLCGDAGIKGILDDTEVIETLDHSKRRFTKRDQLKAMTVRRFQHVAAYPSNENISYSLGTNGVKTVLNVMQCW